MEDGLAEKETTAVRKLFAEIGPRFAERQGGYTRIIPLPLRRVGDNGQLVLLQLVEEGAPKKASARPDKGGQTADQPEQDAEEAVVALEQAPAEQPDSEQSVSPEGEDDEPEQADEAAKDEDEKPS